MTAGLVAWAICAGVGIVLTSGGAYRFSQYGREAEGAIEAAMGSALLFVGLVGMGAEWVFS